ncbi:hypothetical protein KSP40_PGU000712 [Platanthera guangdongensis]|uniref:Glycosyl transferase family 28 C-terminal domain-containing protein n=1 Tax=Platanthera guangdongensis TaxID=2320717 RepID=A0ABR2M0G9_9ASPA
MDICYDMLAENGHAMELAYASADLIVSRAGAMTCTEVLTAGKPSILIPSPTAIDDHQTKNVYATTDIAGAQVLTEDELDSTILKTVINNVLDAVRTRELIIMDAIIQQSSNTPVEPSSGDERGGEILSGLLGARTVTSSMHGQQQRSLGTEPLYFPRDKSLVCGNPHWLSGDSGGMSQAEARLHFFPESGGTDLEE